MRLEIDELTDWLWCLRAGAVQSYAVREREGFNLIDALVADQEDAILAALASIRGCAADDVHVYELALTHAHVDHCGSAAGLVERAGARVAAPAREAAVVEGEESLPPPQLRDWEQPIWNVFGAQVPPARPVRVQTRLRPGARLGWERAAQVVAAPGHTPGSIAFWFEEEKVLVAGDAVAIVAGRPVSGVFNIDVVLADRTFAELARLDSELACFGHGEPLRAGAARALRAAAREQGVT